MAPLGNLEELKQGLTIAHHTPLVRVTSAVSARAK